MAQVEDLLGTEGREFVQGMITSASRPSTGLVATLIGIVTLLFGAEFTQVYANRYGSKIVPDPGMVKITEQERAQKGIPHERTMEKANR